MSWTHRDSPHDAFAQEATQTPITVAFPQWMINVWEVSHGKKLFFVRIDGDLAADQL